MSFLRKIQLLIYLMSLSTLSGCFIFSGKKWAIKTTVPSPINNISEASKISVASLNISNDQVTINGAGFNNVNTLKITGTGFDQTLSINTKTDSQIIAVATSSFSLLLDSTFNLVMETANAQATFPITFTLQDGAVTAAKLNAMGATAGQFLKYNGTNWVPTSLSPSQTYLGTWNANTNNPDISSLGSFTNGDYFIVSTGGTYLGITYRPGDWAMFNGTAFEKIDNSSNVVASFNGRRGVVVPASGDYGWSDITKTGSKLQDIADVDVSARADGNILIWNAAASKWVASTYTSTPPDGSVSTNTINNGSVTYAKTNFSDGDIPQAKINGLVTALSGKEPTITASTSTKYFRGDKTFQTLDTSVVPENTNLYFTNARVLGVPLSGYATGSNSAVSSADTIIGAIAKLEGQISAKQNSSSFIDWTVAGLETLEPTRLNLITANRAVSTNGAGNLVATAVTATELGYLSGVTSAIQTQINSKQATIDKTTAQPVSKLRVYGANGANYVELNAASLTANRSLIFPDSNGSNGNVLSTDGSGNLSWIALPSAPVTSVNGNTGAVTLNSDGISEGSTNLYYTNARTLASTITAPTLTNSAIASGDTVQAAFGKLQAQATANATNIATNTTNIVAKADKTNNSQTITAAVITGLTAPVAGSDAANKTYVDSMAGAWTVGSGAQAGNIYRSFGNVGIGTIAPLAPLDIKGTISNLYSGVNQDFTSNATVDFSSTIANYLMHKLNFGSGLNVSGPFVNYYADNKIMSSNSATIGEIDGYFSNGLSIGNDSTNLGTITELVSFKSRPVNEYGGAGNVGVISNARGFRVINSAANVGRVTNQVGVSIDHLTGGSNNTGLLIGTSIAPSGNYAIYSNSTYGSTITGSLTVGALNITGATSGTTITGTTFTGTSFIYSSDRRLKTNIRDIEDPLEKVLSLKGVFFDWKKTGETDMGFIAQEVEKVVPEVVKTNKETSFKAVKYGNLVALVIEALKDFYHEVQDKFLKVDRKIASVEEENKKLKSQLATQQKEIDTLSKRLDALEKKNLKK